MTEETPTATFEILASTFATQAAIALGQPCPVMAAGRSEEETEKRLGAALLAGQFRAPCYVRPNDGWGY